MRGKVCGGGVVAVVEGITPAYAGKRRSSPGRASGRGDHPRMCGEKMMKAGSNCAMLGSPPRMRGKADGQALLHPIPEDHPRVCGEKQNQAQFDASNKGSPPRMRGKVKNF